MAVRRLLYLAALSGCGIFYIAYGEWFSFLALVLMLGLPWLALVLSLPVMLTFRVRLADDQAFLTLKGPVSGCSRKEFEYPIPVEDAKNILNDFCGKDQIEKYRYRIPAGNRVWEIDEFLGRNAGLILAEIELESPDEPFARPEWLGREVTSEFRFYNSHLLEYPYREWKDEEKL